MRSTEDSAHQAGVLRAMIRCLTATAMWANIALVLFFLFVWFAIAPLG